MATCVMINRDPDDAANIQIIGPFQNQIVAEAYREVFVKDMVDEFVNGSGRDVDEQPPDDEAIQKYCDRRRHHKEYLFENIVIEDVIEPY